MTGRTSPSSDERLAALHDKLVAAVTDLVDSDRWRQMLDAASRFSTYSPSNVLLIAAQRPDATRVAGIRTWNNLGRRVIKGEHGIAILAPCTYRNAPDDAATDTASNPRTLASAEPIEPTSMRELRGFRVVHVFDISQTEGMPLPDVEPRLLVGDAPQQLWDHLAECVAEDSYALQRGPCPAGVNGYTAYERRIVRVRDDVEPAQATKTLAHELGHIRADHEHRFSDYARSAHCRGRAEVEAESIAYLVAARAGLDTTDYSLPYIATWAEGRPDMLRESVTQVLTAARSIGTPDGPQDYSGTRSIDAPLDLLHAGRAENRDLRPDPW